MNGIIRILPFYQILMIPLGVAASFANAQSADGVGTPSNPSIYREYQTEEAYDFSSLIDDDASGEVRTISVEPVYVPDLPGESGFVGQYECPLNRGDKGELREIASSYYIENDLSIIFSRGTDRLSIVLALRKNGEPEIFSAYRARIDIQVFPAGPVRGRAIQCDIIFASELITGQVLEGRRDLTTAQVSYDAITQGLMAKVAEFAQMVERREPSPQFPRFDGLFRGIFK